jgi:hypothetical protein
MTIIQKGAPVCHVVVTLLMMMYQVQVCFSSISASLASVSASTSRLSLIYNESHYHGNHRGHDYLQIQQRTDNGLAVLVHLSKQDQEIGEEGGKTHVIQWLRREEGDYDDDNENERYYIELNRKQIYVDIDILNETRMTNNNKSSSLTHHDDLSYYSITTKCVDTSPTFYKTESLQQLHSRLYN